MLCEQINQLKNSVNILNVYLNVYTLGIQNVHIKIFKCLNVHLFIFSQYFVLKDPKTETQKPVGLSVDRLKAYFVLPDQIKTSTLTNKPDEEPPPPSS